MKNAQKEFTEHTSGKEVKCAIVTRYDDDTVVAWLKVGYTNDDYKEFLRLLDFEYDSGYGIWTLEGAIWYADGTHSDRREYDGSEWWEYMGAPTIPDSLQ